MFAKAVSRMWQRYIQKELYAVCRTEPFPAVAYTTRAEATTMLVRMIDSSYRVEMYGDVAFNRNTDVMSDGKMTSAKSKEFIDCSLKI